MTTDAATTFADARTMCRNVLIALAIAVATACFIVIRGSESHLASDFDQLWYAARALFRGVNPYDVIGPGREFDWDFLYYPLPAVLLVAPLALLPLLAARIVFGAISAGALAYVTMRESSARMLLFLGAPALVALGRGQYGPLILSAVYLPWLAWIGVAKPNIGLAVLPATRSWRRTVVSGAVGVTLLIGASFLVLPSWILSWRTALSQREIELTPVLLRAGGFAILLVLLRWRRPESWLLLALGSIPQTPGFYDTLPLFLIPRGFRQTAWLALTSNVAFLFVVTTLGAEPRAAPTLGERQGLAILLGLYLPCVWFILRRPNANAQPDGKERPITRTDLVILGGLLVSAFFATWAMLSRYHA